MATFDFIYKDSSHIDPKTGLKTRTGVENRVWYLNIISVTMILISSLITGTVNAPIKFGDDSFPRWKKCALNGATNTSTVSGCSEFGIGDDAAKLVMERIFTISLVLALLNAVTLLIGAIAHRVRKVTYLHFELQMLLSIINVGLFAGLVGWMMPVNPMDDAINGKFSVYLKGVNIYIAAIIGLVFSVFDLVVFSCLRLFVFKSADKCGSAQIEELP